MAKPAQHACLPPGRIRQDHPLASSAHLLVPRLREVQLWIVAGAFLVILVLMAHRVLLVQRGSLSCHQSVPGARPARLRPLELICWKIALAFWVIMQIRMGCHVKCVLPEVLKTPLALATVQNAVRHLLQGRPAQMCRTAGRGQNCSLPVVSPGIESHIRVHLTKVCWHVQMHSRLCRSRWR